jgi:putative Holliday junction resolvase
MPNREGYVIAIDFGTRHLGVAVGQTITGTASGLTTLSGTRGLTQESWRDLLAIVDEYHPLSIVVGLPLNMDDSESEMSGRVREFATQLAGKTDTSIEFVDERLTSYAAKSELREAGKATQDNHELAAVLIAESWLNARR